VVVVVVVVQKLSQENLIEKGWFNAKAPPKLARYQDKKNGNRVWRNPQVHN
jgi:hypothetical protein